MNTLYVKNKIVSFILIGILLIYVFQEVSYAQDRGKIYWIEFGEIFGKIRRANLNGTAAEDLVTELPLPEDIALDLSNGKIYWNDMHISKIQRANFDGSMVEDIISGFTLPPDGIGIHKQCRNGKCTAVATIKDGKPIDIPLETLITPACIAVDPDEKNLYWMNIHFYKLQHGNFNGTNIEDIRNLDVSAIYNIEIDQEERKIYWTNFTHNKIVRANFDGTEYESLITDIKGVRGLALDIINRKIYWSNTHTGKIQRASLDNKRVEDLVTGLSYPYDIALNLRSGKIYWVDIDPDSHFGKIQRSNLDGTNVRDVLTKLDSPTSIAVDPDGFYDVSPDSDKLTTTWAKMKTQ